jgi:hypothetical protein
MADHRQRHHLSLLYLTISPLYLRENDRGQTRMMRMLGRKVELKLLKLTAVPLLPEMKLLEKRAQ